MGLFGNGLQNGQGFYLGYQPSATPTFSGPMFTQQMASMYAGSSAMDGFNLDDVNDTGLLQQTKDLVNLGNNIKSGVQNTIATLTQLVEDNGGIKEAQKTPEWKEALNKLGGLNQDVKNYNLANNGLLKENKIAQNKLWEKVNTDKSQDSYVFNKEGRRTFLWEDPNGGVRMANEGQEDDVIKYGGKIKGVTTDGLYDVTSEDGHYYLTFGDYHNAQEYMPLIDENNEFFKPEEVLSYKAGSFNNALTNYATLISKSFNSNSGGGFGLTQGIKGGNQEANGISYIKNWGFSNRNNYAALQKGAVLFHDSMNAEEIKDFNNEYHKQAEQGTTMITYEDKDGVSVPVRKWVGDMTKDEFLEAKIAATMDPLYSMQTNYTESAGSGSQRIVDKANPKVVSTKTATDLAYMYNTTQPEGYTIMSKRRNSGGEGKASYAAGNALPHQVNVRAKTINPRSVNEWREDLQYETIKDIKDGKVVSTSRPTTTASEITDGDFIYFGTGKNLLEVDLNMPISETERLKDVLYVDDYTGKVSWLPTGESVSLGIYEEIPYRQSEFNLEKDIEALLFILAENGKLPGTTGKEDLQNTYGITPGHWTGYTKINDFGGGTGEYSMPEGEISQSQNAVYINLNNNR